MRDLKTFVFDELKGHPIYDRFNVDDIRIYEAAGDQNQADAKHLADDQPLCHDRNYLAFEVFEVLPTDMFRTVKLDQLLPATFCLPELRNVTKLSPLLTAAASSSERGFPWYSLARDEENEEEVRVRVHGISVFCKAAAIAIQGQGQDNKISNPLEEFYNEAELNQTHSLDLKQYGDLFKGEERNPELGILTTAFRLVPEVRGRVRFDTKKGTVYCGLSKKEKKRRAAQGLASDHVAFFRFKIPKNTDLGKHGMLAVYDNLGPSENHCTLVENPRTPVQQGPPQGMTERTWKQVRGVNIQILMPEDVRLGELTDAKIKSMQEPAKENEQPEFQEMLLSNGQFLVFPCLAANFQLHDFVLKGRAEPSPLDDFKDTESKSLYHAALVLFATRHADADEVYEAMRVLEAAHYDVNNISLSVRTTLFRAMDQVDKDEVEEMEIEDLGDLEPYDALDEGIDILSRLPEEGSSNVDSLTHKASDMNLSEKPPSSDKKPPVSFDAHFETATPRGATPRGATPKGTEPGQGDSPETQGTGATGTTVGTAEDRGQLDSLLNVKGSSSSSSEPDFIASIQGDGKMGL